VDLETPLGKATVQLCPHQSGAWRWKQRLHFASALTRHWEEILAFLVSGLVTGRSLSLSRFKSLCERFFSGPEASSQAQIALQQVNEFISHHGASSLRETAAKADELKIVRHVMQNGFPTKAVNIFDGKIRVNVLRVAVTSTVPLAAINLYGRVDSLQKDLDHLASKQPWSIGEARYIPTENKPHGHRKDLGLVVDFGSLQIARGGLLDDMLDSFQLPADHHGATLLMRQVSWLITNEKGGRSRDRIANSARRALGTPVCELNGQDAIGLVEGLARRMADRVMKDRTRNEYLAGFFGRVANVFEKQGLVRPKWRAGIRRTSASTRRGLISDQPDGHASKPGLRPSIVHVAVGSPNEARAKAIEHLDERLKRIGVACEQEIEAFIKWREFLGNALVARPDSDAVLFKPKMVNLNACQSNAYRAWLREGDLVGIAHCMMSSASELGMFREDVYTEMRAAQHSVLVGGAFERFCAKFPFLKYWIRSGVRSPWLKWLPLTYWYVPRQVQLAIEIKIQIATAWNRATIRNLHSSGVNLKEMELQAIKNKVGKTQHGYLDPSDRILRRGLELMLDHDKLVTANWSRGWSGIFTTPVRLKGHFAFDLDYEAEVLKRFIECHKLPRFSREQLRNQKAASRYLKSEDPNEIQGLLGHGDLGVTTDYIKHSVMSVLNRANVAAFQKQLAATIVWASEGDKGVRRRAMNRHDVNPKLLFPVTDNPVEDNEMPPECDTWMTDTSRDLMIDPLRIAHLVRQRAYYAKNWQRLRAENPDRFRVVHLPRLEFTSALWEIVCDSPYAELLGTWS